LIFKAKPLEDKAGVKSAKGASYNNPPEALASEAGER